jgi:NitT/TauT family transport system ATP-binding protein
MATSSFDGKPTTEVAIDINHVTFGYQNGTVILDDVDLKIHRGEIVILIGPSGCGKSTLLNLIAGTISASSGEVTTNGEVVHRLNRRVTYMTQKDTLLPWRNGIDNAALPLEIKGVPRKERLERAREAMSRVGVIDAELRRPHQLSGGMRSRLSLARAMLSETDLLLMDEPFAAIDALRRVHLQQLLISVWQDTGKTLVYVTHDLNEALNLGHRIIVMGTHPGRILLERPVTAPQPRDVARFRATPEAEELYRELWDALEKQFKQ